MCSFSPSLFSDKIPNCIKFKLPQYIPPKKPAIGSSWAQAGW